MKTSPPPWLKTEAKPRDVCPHCGKGKLDASPPGKHLMCPKCGRTELVVPVRSLRPEIRAKLRESKLR